MRGTVFVALFAGLSTLSCAFASSSGSPTLGTGVWPLPRSYSANDEVTTALPPSWGTVASSKVSFLDGGNGSELLSAALERFEQRVSALGGRGDGVASSSPYLHIDVASSAERADGIQLSSPTDADYTIRTSGPRVSISAATVYGAMHALETLLQLVEQDGDSLVLPSSSLALEDGPDYAWRGIMIDAGRRFFPVPLMKNIIDTLAVIKMNVLHLHASDHCRFSVESKKFPELTASLTGDRAGHYTQDDIRELVAYGKARGIAIVPEFDVPGHARGMLPLQANGAEFCDPPQQGGHGSQLHGTPNTLSVLDELMTEMASLFSEQRVFGLGCDETAVLGPCTLNSTFELERSLIKKVQSSSVNKTVSGWEEILFDAGAATGDTIVYAWSQYSPASVAAKGFRAIDSTSRHFYLTAPMSGSTGWDSFWYDINSTFASTPSADPSLLLGGEVSMWTDTYCAGGQQCGASSGPNPVATKLFPPTEDAAFATSVGGMIFPRALVGAGSFWRYDAGVNASSPEFADAIWKLNDRLRATGAKT